MQDSHITKGLLSLWGGGVCTGFYYNLHISMPICSEGDVTNVLGRKASVGLLSCVGCTVSAFG